MENDTLTEKIEKKYIKQDRRKKQKMKVSGKSVFGVKQLKDRKVGK